MLHPIHLIVLLNFYIVVHAQKNATRSVSKMAGEPTQLCFMQNGWNSKPGTVGCVSVEEGGNGINNLTKPDVQNFADTPVEASELLFKEYKRSVCLVMEDGSFYCKGHNETDCYKDGEIGKESTYSTCHLATVWYSDNSGSEELTKSCVYHRYAKKEKFTAETCFFLTEQENGPERVTHKTNKRRIDVPEEFSDVLRIECDYFGTRATCVGYTQNYCYMNWDQKTESDYSNCGATRICSSSNELCKRFVFFDENSA